MSKKRISGRSLDNSITSEDILGKVVIDGDGRHIGIVDKVLLDPVALDFVGIEVDKGFLRRGLSIGKDYIERISTAAVFLNISVVYEIKGMIVFDALGANLGTVYDVRLFGEKNKLETLVVKPGFMHTLLQIPAEFITTIGNNVILSVKKEDVLAYNKEQQESP